MTHLIRSVYLFVFAVLMMALPAQAAPRARDAGGKTVVVGSVKDKDGHDVKTAFRSSSWQKLREFRPSALMSEGEQYRSALLAQCGKPGKITATKLVKKFAVEAASFNMAVGLSAGQQAAEDPAYFRHFVEHSITDPMAHVSFAGFMLGNHGAAAFFSMTGMSFDPCRTLRKNPNAALRRLEEKRLQKYFKVLAGPMAMSAGLIVSDIMHQALTDPNIRKCASYQVGSIHGRTVDDKKKKMDEAKQACDVAYDDWVLNSPDKIRALVPDMVQMTAVTAVMAIGSTAARIGGSGVKAAWNSKGLTAARAGIGDAMMARLDNATVKYTWVQSSRLLVMTEMEEVMAIGEMIPAPAVRIGVVAVGAVGTFAQMTAGSWVFLTLQNNMEFVKTGATSFMDGNAVLTAVDNVKAELARIKQNNWVYTVPATPAECSTYQLSPMASAGVAGGGGMPFLPQCFKSSLPPDKLILRLGAKEKEWRDFLMQNTASARNNWQDYVLNFSNMFTNSKKFYSDILRYVWQTKYTKDKSPTYLDQGAPLYGANVFADRWPNGFPQNWPAGSKICNLIAPQQDLYRIAVDKLIKAIHDESRPSIVLPWKPTGIIWGKGNGWTSWIPRGYTYKEQQGRFAIGAPDHYDVQQLLMMAEGFAAMDCRLKMQNVERDLKKPLAKASPDEIERLRWARYSKAVSALYWELMGTNVKDMGVHQDFRLDIDSSDYADNAASNVFMDVNLTLGGPEPLFGGAFYVKSLRGEKSIINQDLRDQHPDKIGQVATRSMSDFLITSMVCGPNAQNSVEQSKVFGMGWSADFHPPRIVSNLGYDLCSARPARGVWLTSTHGHALGAELPDADPYMSIWNIQGRNYRGMVDIVKAFTAQEVINGKDEHGNPAFGFEAWWSRYLDSQAMPLFQRFRKRFVQDVIVKNFFPALTNPSYSTGRNFIVMRSKPLAMGLTNAMLDSAKEHLDLLAPIALQGASKEDVAAYKKAGDELLLHLRIGLMMISPAKANLRQSINMFANSPEVAFDQPWENDDQSLRQSHSRQSIGMSIAKKGSFSYLDEDAFNAWKLNLIDLKHSIANLQEMAAKHAATNKAAVSTLNPVIQAITNNIMGMVTEIDTYHGFLVSIRLDVAG